MANKLQRLIWWRRSKGQQNASAGDPEHGPNPLKPQQSKQNIGSPTVLRFRSRFLILQNVIGMLLSVAILVIAFWVTHAKSSNGEQCAAFMRRPIVIVGSLLLLISLVGLIAAVVNKLSATPLLEWLHLILVFCLVILLFCFAIFSLEITNQGLAHHVTGYGQSYKEYRLKEYPKWMQHRIKNADYWSKVKTCLQNARVCGDGYFPDFSTNITYFLIEDLTPIQRGCCIPPSACNISFTGSQEEMHNVIPTMESGDVNKFAYGSMNIEETKDKFLSTTIHAYTHDCIKWNSNPYQLCFNCDTCKASVIQSNMDTWKNAGILYVILVMIMVFVCALFACYGFVDRKSQDQTSSKV